MRASELHTESLPRMPAEGRLIVEPRGLVVPTDRMFAMPRLFLQTVRGFNAIETGLVFTAATAGILAFSLAAERLVKRYAQRTLTLAGFVVTVAGIGLLVGLVGDSSRVVAFVPGLLLIGPGLGVMLTPSVNVVQSSFP